MANFLGDFFIELVFLADFTQKSAWNLREIKRILILRASEILSAIVVWKRYPLQGC